MSLPLFPVTTVGSWPRPPKVIEAMRAWRSSARTLEELRSAGAAFVRFDRPVLTEVAFAPARTRTFMCAALAARKDPNEELER